MLWDYKPMPDSASAEPLIPKYKRVLLKLSGEAFGHGGKSGINLDETLALATQMKRLVELKVQLAVVVGGGNFLRGAQFSAGPTPMINPATADSMGMLATFMNGLALQDVLERLEIPTRLLSAVRIDSFAEPFIRRRAIRHLEKGRVVILAGGTGNPYVTTDSAAALRGRELNVDILLKATRVDGIYNDDPEKNPHAVKYERVSYQKVIDSGVDLVILATPPGFRPMMIEAAVKAGKNIFTEKPVGVDGPGIRRVLAAAKMAKEKGLAVVAGTQRRHQAGYVESMKRIHDGAIGDLVGGQIYWNQGPLWNKPRQAAWSDMEWQLRNWLYFTWLSGDHIVEQHVHNIDVANWAFGGHPERAVGMGGRQVRTDPAYGHIFDHFAIDFEYPNGAHVMSMARQIEGCENNVSETIVGTKGSFHSGGYRISGANKSKFDAKEVNPYVQEHIDLIASIRAGKPLNELQTVAESTLTAIMGRMSAYTGQAITWEQALDSKQDTMPKDLVFGPLAVPAVAMPGVTEFF